MATKKSVVKRRKGALKKRKSTFNFTPAMIPSWVAASNGTKFLVDYRDLAWKAYEKLELPKPTDEPWRRTNISKLAVDTFVLPKIEASAPQIDIPTEILNSQSSNEYAGEIVLTAGEPVVRLDPEIAKMGVIFTDLRTASDRHPKILKKILGKVVSAQEGKFAAMAAALAGHGVLLYVPKGVTIDKPLRSLIWSPGAGLAYFSHILVLVEEQASVTYMHESVSPSEKNQSLHAGIVEIQIEEGSNFRFIEVQNFGRHMWNFTHKRARIERDSTLDWIFGAIGSHLTKDFSEIEMVGEGSTARMSAFYFTDDVQHLDHDTQQNHLAPNTTSDLLFKGALKDKSRSVWQGMIYVAPGAQKTDGYQHNPNLVLSENARADSIPGLEILADDVRCTHGSTVGNIDPEELFYLTSRGIPVADAERLIVEGFFDPVLARVPFAGIRDRLNQLILDKLK